MEYRLSEFCFFSTHKDAESTLDNTFVYSEKSGLSIELEPVNVFRLQNSMLSLPDNILQKLTWMEALIPAQFDEESYLLRYREAAASDRASKCLRYLLNEADFSVNRIQDIIEQLIANKNERCTSFHLCWYESDSLEIDRQLLNVLNIVDKMTTGHLLGLLGSLFLTSSGMYLKDLHEIIKCFKKVNLYLNFNLGARTSKNGSDREGTTALIQAIVEKIHNHDHANLIVQCFFKRNEELSLLEFFKKLHKLGLLKKITIVIAPEYEAFNNNDPSATLHQFLSFEMKCWDFFREVELLSPEGLIADVDMVEFYADGPVFNDFDKLPLGYHCLLPKELNTYDISKSYKAVSDKTVNNVGITRLVPQLLLSSHLLWAQQTTTPISPHVFNYIHEKLMLKKKLVIDRLK